jgi:hypothetical protein
MNVLDLLPKFSAIDVEIVMPMSPKGRAFYRDDTGIFNAQSTGQNSHLMPASRRWHFGVYHSVSKGYSRRCLREIDFMWTRRKRNEVERTILAIRTAQGKRLMYRRSTDPTGY